MELRQLEAFAAVANELHFTRTTRRVALTSAGTELLARTKVILDQVAAARSAVRRVAGGEAGVVRVGLTPPVAPVLGPHLRQLSARETPEVAVELRRMWLPSLTAALTAGDIDVAITCALVPEHDGLVTEVFCGEPLLVGVPPDHRLAAREHIALADLAHDVLGLTPPSLFPAWSLAQQQALAVAGVHPPTTELDDPDLTASRWADQPEVAWVLLIGSLTSTHTSTVLRPADPPQLVPFVLQWNPDRAHTMARFVHTALTGDLPPG